MRTTVRARTREPASLKAIVRDRGRDPEIQCQRQNHRQSQKGRDPKTDKARTRAIDRARDIS